MAGKIRVWVEVADGEAIMFKFDKDPTIQMLKDEIQRLVVAKEKEKQLETEIK